MDPASRTALSAALSRLAHGERAAADSVFKMLWPVLRTFCARILRDSPRTEDVAQSALVKVFEQASLFDARRDALAWALEISLWECRTEIRRQGRSRERPWAPAAEQVAERSPSPEERVETAELRAALASALDSLPALDRETLELSLSGAAAPIAAATWRKRKERALGRLKLLWRTLYGVD